MMPNPKLLLCDTDALIQIFLTRQIPILRELKQTYGVQPAIVPEVEMELSRTPKFETRFEPNLKKALSNGLLLRLDETTLQPYAPGPPASLTMESIQRLGATHYKHIDRGEAYTHAAAICLNQPALSNDSNAIEVLEFNGFACPSPVLRFYDLVVFGFQVGQLNESNCDWIRKSLRNAKEFIPYAFRSASFSGGLQNFTPRLIDGTKPPVNARPCGSRPHECQLFVSPLGRP